MTTWEWVRDKIAALVIVLVAIGALLIAALMVPLLVFPGVRRWLDADGLHDAALEQRRRSG